jgi:PTS system N-acetylglucosamine-specific IIC component
MFGLPAACLAMYHAARPDRRKAVGGLLLSMALTSFLTGVTEPVEFTFMFLAPLLYLVHALLTGAAHVIMDLLNVKLGFTFSAGAIDYALSYNRGTNAWMLAPVGLVYFALYYGLFRVCIQVFNLATPGRERELVEAAPAPALAGSRGEAFVRALGGAANLSSIDACTTRLRLMVKDQRAVDEATLRALGARGLVRPSATTLQVVLGPIADQVAGEMRAAWSNAQTGGDRLQEHAQAGAVSASAGAGAPAPTADEQVLAERLIGALGGANNIRSLSTCASRLRVETVDASPVREADIRKLRIRGLVRAASNALHIIIGPRASAVEAGMRSLM